MQPKLKMLELVACPVDKGPLEFHPFESKPSAEGVILNGMLLNKRLKIAYPVMNAVPRLLPLDEEGWAEFNAQGAERFSRELPGFTLPKLS
jgi:uncharacterized protein YbaR (Trm112 family)